MGDEKFKQEIGEVSGFWRTRSYLTFKTSYRQPAVRPQVWEPLPRPRHPSLFPPIASALPPALGL